MTQEMGEMTPQEAADFVRAGLKVAKAHPERWAQQGLWVGWLLENGRKTGTFNTHEVRVGACGCAIGLGALMAAGGKLRIRDVHVLAIDVILRTLNAHCNELGLRISGASEVATNVDGMIARVTTLLDEAGL